MCSLSYLPDNKFNEQTFNEYYAELEQFIYTNKPIKYHVVLPLENFNCALDSPIIQLSGDIKIVSARSTFYPDIIEEDKDRWMNELCPEVDYYDPPTFFLKIDRKMKRKAVSSESKEDIKKNVWNKLQEVIKVLRLFKEGDLRFGFVYWYSEIPCDPPHDYDDIFYYFGNYYTPNKYLLEEGDVEKLQLLLQKYSSTMGKEDFPQHAIDYLNDGVKEDKPAKKILDYIAGLESLLVKEKLDNKNILTKRAANFIGKNREEWLGIINDIEYAYKLRSKIVHGSKGETSLSKCEEYSKKMENYARQSINKWLDMVDKGIIKQDILDSIERIPFS